MQRQSKAWSISRAPKVSTVAIVGMMALIAPTVGCEPDNNVAPGSPVLVAFQVLDPSTMSSVTTAADGGVVTAPPLSTFNLIFDRLLKSELLVDVPDGGGLEDRPGAVSIAALGDPTVSTLFTLNGDSRFTLFLPAGPSLSITPQPSLPSGSTVVVSLDVTKFKSEAGDPLTFAPGLSASLTLQTDPFSATIVPPPPDMVDGGADPNAGALPPGHVATDYVAQVKFNNHLPDDAATHVHVALTDAFGQPAAGVATVTVDMTDPDTLDINPPDGGWPAGGNFTVAVDEYAADVFGIKLGAPVTAAFFTKS